MLVTDVENPTVYEMHKVQKAENVFALNQGIIFLHKV